MKPTLGWTQVSRDALKRAESRIKDDDKGVRDEVGFLMLHQAYADRFFPGTSVLQTRLRYLLFVPWIYQRVANQSGNASIDDLLQREELRLIRKLKRHYTDYTGKGVIGGRSEAQGRLTSQPSGMVYWTALGRFGLLKPLADGSMPVRSVIHRSLRKQRVFRIHDDDKQPLEESRNIFSALPNSPPGWDKADEPISFDLPNDDRDEREFLLRQLVGVMQPGKSNSLSLIAQLAKENVDIEKVRFCWSQHIKSVADPDDRKALERARQAAAISAIGRGVYAALVEKLYAEDGHTQSDTHYNNLIDSIGRYKKQALRLDVTAVKNDAPAIDSGFLTLLETTQKWLKKSNRDIEELWVIYKDAEFYRKRSRARLPRTRGGELRRLEWPLGEGNHSEPLHYRWYIVKRLLMDLWGKK